MCARGSFVNNKQVLWVKSFPGTHRICTEMTGRAAGVVGTSSRTIPSLMTDQRH